MSWLGGLLRELADVAGSRIPKAWAEFGGDELKAPSGSDGDILPDSALKGLADIIALPTIHGNLAAHLQALLCRRRPSDGAVCGFGLEDG